MNMGTPVPSRGAGRYWHGRGLNGRAEASQQRQRRACRTLSATSATLKLPGLSDRRTPWTGGAQNLAGLWNYQKNMGELDRGQRQRQLLTGLFGGNGLGRALADGQISPEHHRTSEQL